MTATAEAYGFGARSPYAQMRESEYDMKERVRLSGLFPRVRNQPMSVQLQGLVKEFEKNAALTGILERRRLLEDKKQYELRGREAVVALNTNLAPPFRTGTAGFASSAAVASKVADVPVPDAADVMTGQTATAKNAASANAANAKVTIQKERTARRPELLADKKTDKKAVKKVEKKAATQNPSESSKQILAQTQARDTTPPRKKSRSTTPARQRQK